VNVGRFNPKSIYDWALCESLCVVPAWMSAGIGCLED
jgi:hypothetical protein